MSKISLSPSPTGSAVYTIASPAGSTDRTLNLPDSAGTVATAESTLAQFNVTGDAPVFACRAFVNFNGTGTVAIRASGNVSSITDNGTGNYTVNFTTAMPDANYSATGTAIVGTNSTLVDIAATPTTSGVQIRTVNVAGGSIALIDISTVCVSIFR